jgi:hypothetical protein
MKLKKRKEKYAINLFNAIAVYALYRQRNKENTINIPPK